MSKELNKAKRLAADISNAKTWKAKCARVHAWHAAMIAALKN